METALESEINLLPEEEIVEEPLNRFFVWALSLGRYILVTVLAASLLVFFARFKLDSDIFELKEVITTKARILAASSQFEEEFLTYQQKLREISKLEQSLTTHFPLLDLIETDIPQEITLNKTTLSSTNQLLISGRAASFLSVSQLQNSLAKDPRFGRVSLISLGREEESGKTIFSLEATLGPLPTPTVFLAPGEGRR